MTLTLDRVIRHTAVYHSSTSFYIAYQISLKSEKSFSVRMDTETSFISSTQSQRTDFKIVKQLLYTSQLSGTYHQFFAASYLNKFTFHIAITHACHQNGHQNDILRPISVQHIVMWSLDVTFLSQKYIIIHKRH